MKAVIFDLDGVITDTAEYHFQAWASLAAELKIPFDRAFNEQLKGISRSESLEKILALGGVSDHYTIEEKHLLADQKNTHYQQLIAEITPADLLPGIGQLLQELQHAGILTAVASASKNAAYILNRLEIARLFHNVVDVATIRNGKPDPEIFLAAAANLHVEPADCVGIEDAEAGIQAIKGAGMFAIGVGTPSQMQEADVIVESTSQLTLSMLQSYSSRHV